jgi:hypothetical protein
MTYFGLVIDWALLCRYPEQGSLSSSEDVRVGYILSGMMSPAA